eukprot:TRINITY_DN38439_c0_g2_i1.p1 TRINITY_DN38439_c0_g2~~TRINITY_DN38439_c0_g2_i1.p1  ORF type:complete len:601 (-),score=120.56 TRINITY_DN38439_c0_g2_i1:127-1722(-)
MDGNTTVPAGSYSFILPVIVPNVGFSELTDYNVWHVSLCSAPSCSDLDDDDIMVNFPLAGFTLRQITPAPTAVPTPRPTPLPPTVVVSTFDTVITLLDIMAFNESAYEQAVRASTDVGADVMLRVTITSFKTRVEYTLGANVSAEQANIAVAQSCGVHAKNVTVEVAAIVQKLGTLRRLADGGLLLTSTITTDTAEVAMQVATRSTNTTALAEELVELGIEDASPVVSKEPETAVQVMTRMTSQLAPGYVASEDAAIAASPEPPLSASLGAALTSVLGDGVVGEVNVASRSIAVDVYTHAPTPELTPAPTSVAQTDAPTPVATPALTMATTSSPATETTKGALAGNASVPHIGQRDNCLVVSLLLFGISFHRMSTGTEYIFDLKANIISATVASLDDYVTPQHTSLSVGAGPVAGKASVSVVITVVPPSNVLVSKLYALLGSGDTLAREVAARIANTKAIDWIAVDDVEVQVTGIFTTLMLDAVEKSQTSQKSNRSSTGGSRGVMGVSGILRGLSFVAVAASVGRAERADR